MNISQVVVAAFCLIIILSVLSSALSFMIPINAKSRFDQICRNYLLLSESENGLSFEMREELKKKLEQLGLIEVEIESVEPYGIKRGERHRLFVSAVKEYFGLSPFLTNVKHREVLEFDREFVARRVLN